MEDHHRNITATTMSGAVEKLDSVEKFRSESKTDHFIFCQCSGTKPGP